MGMRGIGQITELCAIARPDVGVITSIGPVHLELLGTVEKVAEAKAEVVAALPKGGTAIVPDEPLLEPFLGRDDIDIRRFGPENVETFERTESGCRVVFALDGEKLELEFPFTARHQAQNAVAALFALQALGLPLPEGRVDVELSRWRGEESPLPGGGLLINDSYNANPVSMRAALEHLAGHEGRKVAVLGDMAELGPTAPEYHREVGALIESLGIEEVLAVGDLARDYGGEHARDAAEAAARVKELVQPGDVVLIKGSRAVGLEVVAEALTGVPA
jgi:UDP-N-acetylmuramoyl-tripeptide--D-alanyl-D-alanine ligase